MKTILIGLAALAAASAAVEAAVAPVPDGKGAGAAVRVQVDSVMWRQDVTRVYCRVSSRPHTSDRVDSATLVVPGRPARTLGARDIDGVDFRRWFQWEDDGEIPLEIDFPPCRREPGCRLVLHTVRGDVEAVH